MNILGISGQERDAAAALIRDGHVIAAIEEEKLARIRHVGMNYTGGLPQRAIEFCLERGNITFDQLDYVAYYLEPEKLFHREVAFGSERAVDSVEASTGETFPNYLVESLNGLRQRRRSRRLIESKLSDRGRFVAINHHLAHGASSFFASGVQRAAILSVGNRGDMASTALMVGDGNEISLIGEAQFPNSLGMVYSAVTAALGFAYLGDWHKTMWLSPEGEPEFGDLFQDIVKVDENGLPIVNLEYFDASFKGNPFLSERFFAATGLRTRTREEPLTSVHRNVAASLQRRLEDVLVEIAVRLRERSGRENLCIAGGVALNSLANAALEKRAGYSSLFVQPAAGNAGTSIGAALSLWHQQLGNKERSWSMKDAFLGPEFADDDVKKVLDNCKLDYEYHLTEEKLSSEVARLLGENKIVGWFRGRMEFGPRTLGARSILASPVNEFMRENLNKFIKHREEFRPFSAAVPEERAADFFEPSLLTNFLLGVSRIKPAAGRLVPTAIFGDGLVRVHTVNRETNPSFWRLLVKFGEITGVPVLLNTSFNLFGEPVVSTPREAVRGFYCSGIDCLAIGNFLIKK